MYFLSLSKSHLLNFFFSFSLYDSGAGKTVSAKYIMRYFATADDTSSAGVESMTEVEKQILGNHRT